MTSPHPEVGGSVLVQPHARGETKGPPPRPDASSSQAFTVYVSGEKTHCEETDSKKKEKKKEKRKIDSMWLNGRCPKPVSSRAQGLGLPCPGRRSLGEPLPSTPEAARASQGCGDKFQKRGGLK